MAVTTIRACTLTGSRIKEPGRALLETKRALFRDGGGEEKDLD